MIDDTSGNRTTSNDGVKVPDELGEARINVSRAATARKIQRLPPGEHLVELRARAIPNQMVLRIVAYSTELHAGTRLDLDKIFGQKPSAGDATHARVYASQGALWLGLLVACGLSDDELQSITLAELAEKISGKQVVAIINAGGYWSRVRPL